MEATLFGRAHTFERDGKIYLTTPVVLAHPDERQVEEFAFASAVKQRAPNENIGWLSGRYVEAGRANLNGAMWLNDELALKSLTPMLMPVTVMHDPRTSVGLIADCKFIEEPASARIENVLGIWRHRYPDVWEEAEHNLQRGEMMQSMETYAPWYTCAACERSYVKLPQGAERASWCECLRGDDSRRILRDVCFTGTGLIFGSRGGRGAYTDAYLDHFQDEIAEYHEQVHHDSTYRPNRSASHMALVQIEESELATLRRERDEAKSRVDQLTNDTRELTTKVETAEAEQKKATDDLAAEQQKIKGLEDEKAQTQLRDKRMGQLGTGFMAKLGDTSKTVLTDLAGKSSDEDWDRALKEREELAQVKRDATAAATPPAGGGGGGGDGDKGGSNGDASAFESEEVASFMRSGVATQAGQAAPDGASSVRSLARTFGKRKSPAAAEK